VTNQLKFVTCVALSVVWAFALFSGGIVQSVSAQAQPRPFELIEATIPQLQAALASGTVTSRDLVAMYLARIEAYDKHGPALNAISVNNANALAEATVLDAERPARRVVHCTEFGSRERGSARCRLQKLTARKHRDPPDDQAIASN
jgi:hypothetical protein